MNDKSDQYKSSTETVSTISMKDEESYTPPAPGADFETAISATGFGFFNVLLFLTAIPSILTSQFESSSLSFVFPAAICDLRISLEDRGLINAVLYTGMIASCFMWGSLVDIFGRRKILIITHFLDAVFVAMAAFSPNYLILTIAKFFGGFIINGPSMALTPYLSEFHGTVYRSRVPLTIGFTYSCANIVLPLLAWSILPLNIKLNLWGFELHAWNIFLLLCVLPALTGGMLYIFMPETPKYLMTQGNNEKALEVFHKIYKMNTKKPRDTFPITKLVEEHHAHEKKNSGFKEAWKQISPLFSLKYAVNLTLVCLLQLFLMMCVNTLRLWLPEIFQIMNDYEFYNNETASFCKMMENMRPVSNEAASETCTVNFENDSVYINSVIVAFTAVCGYLVAAFLVNRLGKKKILFFLGLLSGFSIMSVYFAPNSTTALVLICFHLMCSCVCIDIIITIVVDLFPTYLRASALSLALMCGRIGSVLGNLVFPFLLQAGCAPPFFTLGSTVIVCIILSLFLPNTDFKALQ